MDDYLAKPIRQTELTEVLNKVQFQLEQAVVSYPQPVGPYTVGYGLA
jgi:YesN/AraC family two-component response regulator